MSAPEPDEGSHPLREIALPCPPHSFEEPTARPARRRGLPVVPLHVRLEVRLDPQRPEVRGAVTHTVRAIREGAVRLTLDAADLEVLDATADGEPLAFHPHAGGVDVVLPRPLGAGEEATFTLGFHARPTLGLHFVDGERPQAWTQGAMEDHHHWFPCFDAPQHLVTTEVVATVPEPYVALSNGEPVEYGASVEAGWRRFHWRHDTPHALYLLTLVVDDLTTVEMSHAGVALCHHVPRGRETDAERLFERLPEMLDFFAEATGVPYPYPRYGHVFLREFMWGGMENTTLTSLNDQMLVPGPHREEEDVERLWAHELAHQWFGDLIAPRGWPEIWLNESFATYFEILCMEALEGPDDFARRLATERDSYFEEARDRYARPVVTRTYAHPYVLFDRHAYEKGCLLLHTLRDQLGDAAFFAGVRRYVAAARGTAAETSDLRRALEAESGEDLSDFFEHLVYGPGHPKVKVTWQYDPPVGLEVTLERQDESPQALYVTLAAALSDGVRRVRVRLAPGTRTLVLPLPDAPPRWVALDPDQACLVEIDETAESDRALCARLEPAAPRLLKMRTARELGRRASARNTEALVGLLFDDASTAARVEAARALGEHRSDAAREALLRAVRSDAPWRVRQAAAAAAGKGADAGLVDPLAHLLHDEKRHRVRCGLLEGLGEIRDPAARVVIRRYLEGASPRASVAEAAVRALAAQEDPETLDELALRTSPGHPRPVRAAAIAGLARLACAEGMDAGVKRRVRDVLEPLLRDPSFHARHATVAALRRLADPATRPALTRAHDAERFALLRRVMREALGALEDKKG